MKLYKVVDDDDAVSPVIGVILMVAITVILAAVIGTFVLGIGQDQQSTPQQSYDFNFQESDDVLRIDVRGGGAITPENTGSLTVDPGATCANGDDVWLGDTSDSQVSAGDSFEVFQDGAGSGLTAGDVGCGIGSSSTLNGNEVTILWDAPGGGDSQTLGTFNVPA